MKIFLIGIAFCKSFGLHKASITSIWSCVNLWTPELSQLIPYRQIRKRHGEIQKYVVCNSSGKASCLTAGIDIDEMSHLRDFVFLPFQSSGTWGSKSVKGMLYYQMRLSCSVCLPWSHLTSSNALNLMHVPSQINWKLHNAVHLYLCVWHHCQQWLMGPIHAIWLSVLKEKWNLNQLPLWSFWPLDKNKCCHDVMICLSNFQDSVTAVLPAVFIMLWMATSRLSIPFGLLVCSKFHLVFDRTPLVPVNDGSLALYQAFFKPRAIVCIIDQCASRANVFKPTSMTKSNFEPHFEASFCPTKPSSRVIGRFFEREAHAKIYRQHHHVAVCIA